MGVFTDDIPVGCCWASVGEFEWVGLGEVCRAVTIVGRGNDTSSTSPSTSTSIVSVTETAEAVAVVVASESLV